MIKENKKIWKELISNPKGLSSDVFSGLNFPGGIFFIDNDTNI